MRSSQARQRRTPTYQQAARTPPTTTQRGYGSTHKAARAAALAALTDGQLCAECLQRGKHHPMYRRDAAQLDLSHNPSRTSYIGLSWSRCNRQEGALRGNARRRTPTRTRFSRDW